MSIQWILKKFDDLTPHELYAVIRLRNDVFVVEQNCVFQDADNKDPLCWHLMGWDNNNIVAYTRLVPPGIAYKEPSIGRVVTSPSVRGSGAGKQLMEESLKQLKVLYGNISIRIGAQLYLKKFYSSFGFKQSSKIYLEDGIEHIEMLLTQSVS